VVGIDWIDLAHNRDRLEVLVNAVMNLWVTFSGRTPLYEVSYFFIFAGNVASISAYLLSGVVYLPVSQSLLYTILYSQKVLKYADTNFIEFQNSRRNILMKIQTNI